MHALTRLGCLTVRYWGHRDGITRCGCDRRPSPRDHHRELVDPLREQRSMEAPLGWSAAGAAGSVLLYARCDSGSWSTFSGSTSPYPSGFYGVGHAALPALASGLQPVTPDADHRSRKPLLGVWLGHLAQTTTATRR